MTQPIPNVLTIAGSDSGGGAGIQADLKAFSALGAYGASVITALTAQNTRGVTAIHAPEPAFITAQLDAVFDDIRIDAVKIGMLANASIARAVADALRRYKPKHIVLDTVMISKSNHALLLPDAVAAVREELLPLADLLTPNLPEAAALLGVQAATDEAGMVEQGEALRALGARAVLMKGGHLSAVDSPDWLVQDSGTLRLGGPRVPVKNTHGTGCTLSSAIAALIPQRDGLASAVADALRRYKPKHIVLDTVMISKSNHALLLPDAVAAVRDELLPLADLLTPNLPEAAALLGVQAATDEAGMVEQGEALRALGARAVLMKGGHLSAADSPDWLVQDSGTLRLGGPRVPVKNTHGTGCTLSSAIAALIPQRDDLASAVADAKLYLTGALQASDRLDVGGGVGPVHHFYRWW